MPNNVVPYFSEILNDAFIPVICIDLSDIQLWKVEEKAFTLLTSKAGISVKAEQFWNI